MVSSAELAIRPEIESREPHLLEHSLILKPNVGDDTITETLELITATIPDHANFHSDYYAAISGLARKFQPIQNIEGFIPVPVQIEMVYGQVITKINEKNIQSYASTPDSLWDQLAPIFSRFNNYEKDQMATLLAHDLLISLQTPQERRIPMGKSHIVKTEFNKETVPVINDALKKVRDTIQVYYYNDPEYSPIDPVITGLKIAGVVGGGLAIARCAPPPYQPTISQEAPAHTKSIPTLPPPDVEITQPTPEPTYTSLPPTEIPIPATQEANFNGDQVREVIPDFIPGLPPGAGGSESYFIYSASNFDTSALLEQQLVPLTFDEVNFTVVDKSKKSAFIPYLEQITSRSTGETLTLSQDQADSGSGFVAYKNADGSHIEYWLTHVPVPSGADKVVAVVSYNEEDKGTVYAVALDKDGNTVGDFLPIVVSQDEEPTVITNEDGSVTVTVNGVVQQYDEAQNAWQGLPEPPILENWESLGLVDGNFYKKPANRVLFFDKLIFEKGKMVTGVIIPLWQGKIVSDQEVAPGIFDITAVFKLEGMFIAFRAYAANCGLLVSSGPIAGQMTYFTGGSGELTIPSPTTTGLYPLAEPIDPSLFSESGMEACQSIFVGDGTGVGVTGGLKYDPTLADKIYTFITEGKIDTEWRQNGRVDKIGNYERVDLRGFAVAGNP